MNTGVRKLIRVKIGGDEPGTAGDLVERLIGKKLELQFLFLQKNALCVEELDA